MTSLRNFPIVLLNGPPGCGKDTAGSALVSAFRGARRMKMAETLKAATHALYGLPADTTIDAFEAVKEIPSPIFAGLSPRAAYIDFSERLVKPTMGDDWFGRVFVQRLALAQRDGVQLAVATDCGFAREWDAAIEAVGPESVLLIRIHAERRGKTFAGDSRSYIELPVVTLDLHNDGDEAGFRLRVVDAVDEWKQRRAIRQMEAA